MEWVLVGMMCNSLHCYWVQDGLFPYPTAQACIVEMQKIKGHSMMYFDVGCPLASEVKPNDNCGRCIDTPEHR